MSRYPLVLLFRHTNYSYIDEIIRVNTDKLMCTVEIISDTTYLNKLFNPNYHILVTYGDTYDEYSYICKHIPERFCRRWFHKTNITDIDEFNHNVNYCYIDNVIEN